MNMYKLLLITVLALSPLIAKSSTDKLKETKHDAKHTLKKENHNINKTLKKEKRKIKHEKIKLKVKAVKAVL